MLKETLIKSEFPACRRQARLYPLGGLFQMPLYHGLVFDELSGSVFGELSQAAILLYILPVKHG